MILVAVDGAECEHPGLPAGGVLLAAGEPQEVWGSDEEVECRCEDWRVMIGQERRRCVEEGRWSGTFPVCGK